jgi:type IV pilus assembly protein PilM
MGEKIILKKSLKTVVGLDIRKNVLRFVILKSINPLVIHKKGELVLKASILKNGKLANKNMLLEGIKQLFKEHRIKNAYVVFSAFNHEILIRSIPENGMRNEKEVKKYLFLELGESISVPFEQPIFDLLIFEKQKAREKKQVKRQAAKKKAKTIKRDRMVVDGEIYFVATSETTLETLGDEIQQAGGVPAAVDINSLAYSRAINRHIKWSDCLLMIEIDCGVAMFTIFENHIPIYTQYEDYNSANWKNVINEDGSYQAEFNKEKELAELDELGDITNNLLYYYTSKLSNGKSIDKIYLVGENPLLFKEIVSIIETKTEIPVAAINTEKRYGIPSKYLLAAGLAMKGV